MPLRLQRLFRRLWADGRGSIISTEYMLLVGVAVFGGALPAAIGLRNATLSVANSLGNSLQMTVPQINASALAYPATVQQPVFYGTPTTTPQPVAPVFVAPPSP